MENRPHDESFWSNRRWLARLNFSFLIVAVYLLYMGYRGMERHEISNLRGMFYLLGALLAFVMFLMGVRARHRPGE